MADTFKHSDPPGIEFRDSLRHRTMKYVAPDLVHEAAGWFLFKHPDGQWVTDRQATEAEKYAIELSILDVFLGR